MFEFDPAKSEANKAKHGIDFVAAQELWDDPNLFELPSRQDRNETRWMLIGRIESKHWTVVATYRSSHVRIISCRRARREEERLYEQAR